MSDASLFLCHRLPFPPNKGDKIRSYALLKHLASKGPVHVGCFVDDEDDLQYVDDVRTLAGGQCMIVPLSRLAKWTRASIALCTGQPITTAYFGSRVLAHWVSDILAAGPIRNVVVFGSAMAPYLINSTCDPRRVLFDMVDVDSDKWRQYAGASRGPAQLIYSREARVLERLERRAASLFGKTLLVSPFEARTFCALAPESATKVGSLNNGVDLEKFASSEFKNPFPNGTLPIVMTGRMDYRPNYSGAIWFAEQVGPRVFERLPQARIYFVGSNPPASLKRLVGPKIDITGSVDDVRPYIRHAAAIVAPLQLARGVQNKVLEAMAMGKAVVATHEATRALDVTDGVHLWIENDAARFADAIVAAIESPTRRQVAENARRYVEEHHDWQTILKELDTILQELSSDASAPPQRRGQSAQFSSVPYQPNVKGAVA